MAHLTPQQYQAKYDRLFADNEFQNIREATFRDFVRDTRDSFAPLVATLNVPEYLSGTYYEPGDVVRFELAGRKSLFSARQAGYLAAPTDPVQDTNWEATLAPVAATALSQVGAVDALRLAQGQWVPGRLYVLVGRLDAQGAALPDVYVPALTASVLSSTAHTFSQAPALPELVTYDLVSDTTSPIASGGGGPVDAYTRDEADVLLAAKGDELVQAQHTLQLKTLGVQASPAMAYLETGGVEGYGTLDEALADAQAKTFMRFNVATVRVTKSNDPLSPGWASYVDGAGATLELGANVVLSVPGSSLGTLLFKNFFIFQTAGTRGGRVKLLATGNGSTPVGLLPLLNGQCAVPLELSGGAYALTGAYASLLGSGTVHLFEPYDVGFVAPGINLVEHKGGGAVVSGLPLVATRQGVYTLQLTDANCLVPVASSSAVTVTVPAHADVAFPIGTTLYVAQDGAGQVTVVPASGVVVQTADGYRVPGQWQDVALHKRDLNTWVLKGAIA